MKKRAAPFLSAVVLSSVLLNGCFSINISTNRRKDSADRTGSPANCERESTGQSDAPESIAFSGQEKEISACKAFWTIVEQNPYDEWLAQKKAEGNTAEKVFYAEYLGFWKAELLAAMESGKPFFPDTEQYNQWKTGLEQWLESAQTALAAEMDVLQFTMPQLEVIIPHCRMVRQKVLDTKFFLFYAERSQTGDWDLPIAVIWIADLEK